MNSQQRDIGLALMSDRDLEQRAQWLRRAVPRGREQGLDVGGLALELEAVTFEQRIREELAARGR